MVVCVFVPVDSVVVDWLVVMCQSGFVLGGSSSSGYGFGCGAGGCGLIGCGYISGSGCGVSISSSSSKRSMRSFVSSSLFSCSVFGFSDLVCLLVSTDCSESLMGVNVVAGVNVCVGVIDCVGWNVFIGVVGG